MSEHKQPKLVTPGVVTSDEVQRKAGHRTWWPWVAIGLLVLVVLAAAGGAAYKHYIYDPAHKKTAATLDRNSNAFLLHPDIQISAALAEVQKAKTPQQKAAAYNDLAQAYLNDQKPADAAAAANKSLSADSSTTNKLYALNILGYAFSRSGHPDKAVAAFQQLVDILNTSGDASLKQEVPRIQSAIDQIQQGQML